MFSYRRVKDDARDAADLADLLRMGRLPEAWIAPPPTRELRGWVRHRAKLVGLRSNLKCQVHAVLAGAGVQVAMSELFSPGGQKLLAETRLPGPSRARVDSQLRLISALDFEIELFAKLVADRLRTHPGYTASLTPPCIVDGSPNRVPGWCAGPRSRPCNASVRTPAMVRSATVSAPGAAATSVSSPPAN
jgi:hypothetical protein